MTSTRQRWLVAIIFGCSLVSHTNLYGQSKAPASGLQQEGAPMISGGAQSALDAASRAAVADSPPQTLSAEPDSPALVSKGGQSKGVDKQFEGFDFDDNGTENDGFRFIPPDPIGAAGHSRVIAVVNTMIEARNKAGKLKWRDGLSDFFAPLSPTTYTFDPKIVHDPYEDRFVVVTLELEVDTSGNGGSIDTDNISRILLAVSKDGSPNSPTAADWYYHAIDAKQVVLGSFDTWADYPGFEVDEEAVYVTANLFTHLPFGFFAGQRLWIVDKGSGSGGFYDGGAAGVTVHDPAGATGGFASTMMPAKVFGTGGVGGPGSTLGTFLVMYSGLTLGGAGAPEALQVITVDDPLGGGGGPIFSLEFVFVGDIEDLGNGFGFPALPDAPQAVISDLIEVNDRRALDAVWRDDALWVTTTINPNSGPDSSETSAQWFELDTSAGPGAIALTQGGTIGGEDIAAGAFTFFPSVAVNRRNEAKFGFSASAPSIFAGAYVAGRRPGDAPGTVQGSETVKAGEDYYLRTFTPGSIGRNRWGDYSGISVDPSNENFFWVFNEFADQRGTTIFGEDGRWGTAWGRCKFEGRKSKMDIAGELGDPSEELAEAEVANVPKAFSLGQNYPNPFNPSTTITFTLPEKTEVEVAVYNTLGRRVRLLTDGALPAGEHTMSFVANDLPSGLYLLRMTTPNRTFTRRMQLVK